MNIIKIDRSIDFMKSHRSKNFKKKIFMREGEGEKRVSGIKKKKDFTRAYISHFLSIDSFDLFEYRLFLYDSAN